MARIILIVQIAGAPIAAAVVFYEVGFSERPHHVVLASAIASGWFVFVAAGAWLIYHTSKRRANKAVQESRVGLSDRF